MQQAVGGVFNFRNFSEKQQRIAAKLRIGILNPANDLNICLNDIYEELECIYTITGGLDDVYDTLIKGLESYDYKFYTPSSLKFSKASSGSNAVKSLVAIYVGNGYSFSVDGDSTFNSSPDLDNESYYVWKGTVKVYKTDDRDTYFVLSAKENGIVVEFHYGKEGQVSTKSTTGKFFKIYYGNKDLLSYKSYLDQQIKNTLHDNDVTEYDERDWSKYSIERLKSFYDGYEECLTMLDKMELTIEEEVGKTTADLLSSQKSVITELRKKYQAYVVDLAKIKAILEDQVFSLYYCLDSEQLAEQYPPLNNSQDYNYVLQVFTTIQGAVSSLITGKETILYTYDSDGNMTGTQKVKIGSLSSPNRGVQCSNCGSTNLQYDRATQKYTCVNKGCNAGSTKVVTYYNYAQDIVEWFTDNFGHNVYFLDIEDNIRKIQSDLYIRNNFTDENYKELCSFIREDVYENSNYTSDNISDNTKLLESARKFVDRAKQQLVIACVPQISITATVSSLLVQSEIPNEELFDDFAIGNYIRISIDDTVYKLRIIGIKYDFENLEKVEVTFSNVTKSLFGAMSDIQSILQQASSMATSFSGVAKQAENGQSAARKFEHIKKEGLDSSLGAVKAAKNQEIVVDDHGILCRYYNKWLNQYDDRQLKIINQNIVMTDDAWENAKLAIGLGQYNGEAKWGVWADMLVGDLMITKDLKVINDGATVEINKDGIVLDGGAITWKNNKLGTDAIDGLDNSLQDFVDSIGDLQSQIDGEIITWFKGYDPTLKNLPASEWSSELDKKKHNGDLFYNTQNGYAYEYSYNATTKVSSWKKVTDSGIQNALNAASTAQDTADGKRRVFTVTPTPPYDVGDLWAQGDKGDLYKCKTAKTKDQTYSFSDWEKATKYTDDTAWKAWTSDTGDFGKYKNDIQNQLDGKSEATYGGATPPSNPETGDLWFCTDSSKGYGKDKAYMYDGTTWKESNGVPDSVWDKVDGKSSIYVEKPTNGYKENDLWILESDTVLSGHSKGTIMVATSDSTRFNASHWTEKVKYTDDTKANEIEGDLSNFRKAVEGSLGVTTITDNSVISPMIGGGYLYISKDKCSVEIDPSQKHTTNNSNVIKVTANGSDVFHITRTGDAYLKGKITATSGDIGNWKIDDGWLSSSSKYGERGSGLCWNITDGNDKYYTNMNGANLELSKNGALKIRLNSFADDGNVNTTDGNCLYANVGYVGLFSGGNINLRSGAYGNLNLSSMSNVNLKSGEMGSINLNGETHVNNDLCVKNDIKIAYGRNFYGYGKSGEAEIYRIANLTSWSDPSTGADLGYTIELGSSIIGTNVNGAKIWLRAPEIYANDALIHTSDKRVKKDFIPLSIYEKFYMNLNPLGYKFIYGTSGRTHLGFISQEIEEALTKNNLTTKDFAGFIKYNDVETNEEKYALRYEEFIALNTHMIQKLYKRIEELEKRIDNN